MDILRKINKMRLDRNWSIYRLSVESDVPQSTLTNMFNRETLPSITTLESICNAFDVSLSEFFKEDEMQPMAKNKEEELLNIYHALNDEVQESILVLLREIQNRK